MDSPLSRVRRNVKRNRGTEGAHHAVGSVLVAVVLATAGPGAAVSGKAAEQRRPNILFIMSDDHTTQAIGAYGSRLAGLNPTPNIDALAAERDALRPGLLQQLDLHAQPGQHHHRAVPAEERGARSRRRDSAREAVPPDGDEEGGLPDGDDRQVAPEAGTRGLRLLLRPAGPGRVLRPDLPRPGRQALAGEHDPEGGHALERRHHRRQPRVAQARARQGRGRSS